MTGLPDPFAPELTGQRRARLVALLESEQQYPAMIVTDRANLRYLTGFDGTSGAVLITADSALLFTDSRYLLQAQSLTGVTAREAPDPVSGALGEIGSAPVVLEGHHLTASQWRRISVEHPHAALVDDIVLGLRACKDAAEVAALEHACAVSVQALGALLEQGVAGRTEREVARRLGWLLGEGAGEGPGFDSIVASGPNSAVPHHHPTDRIIVRGDLLKIDFGARVLGYHADITRTFVVGRAPQPWQVEVHSAVARAARRARAMVKAGAEIRSIDTAARSIIAEAGFGGRFGHGLGHGVGLAIHERPLIGPRSDGTLAAGMAVTIEPGVYLPQRGGVRIEDTVLVEADSGRCLAELDRGLIAVS